MKDFFSKPRGFLHCILCLSCFYIGPAWADEPAPQTFPEESLMAAKDETKHWTLLRTGDSENDRYLINFNNVSIIEYIRFVSKITGSNFVFEDNELQFNVTIVSEDP